MAPFKVTLVPPKGDAVNLLLPFDGTRSFHELTTVAFQRAAKHCSLPATTRQEDLKLSLGSADGFLIDPDDVVEGLLTPDDVLFITYSTAETSVDQNTALNGLKIRIMTPVLAQSSNESEEVGLLMKGKRYPPTTTLAEIKTDVAHQFGISLPNSSLQPHTRQCNCILADLLVKRGRWNKLTCGAGDAGSCTFGTEVSPVCQKDCAKCLQPLEEHGSHHSGVSSCQSYILVRCDLPCQHVVHSGCLVDGDEQFDCPPSCYKAVPPTESRSNNLTLVAGRGQVESLGVDGCSLSDIMVALKARFGDNFEQTTTVELKGGLKDQDIYHRFPVVSLCSLEKHKSTANATGQSSNTSSEPQLDLHTIEGPICTTNLGLTLEDARLTELADRGILTIYVVEWRRSADTRDSQGKDGMFAAAPHWKLPSGQSDRALAAVLASLRVFAHIVSSEEFDDFRQNEVLHMFHMLTRFPPAVRALHILMDDKTLQPNESAALVQSLAAVSELLIPGALIQNDMRRALEGVRLLLGLILHRIKEPDELQQGSGSSDTSNPRPLPYIQSYCTVDVQDVKTLKPVENPVMTNFGFVNSDVFHAFRPSNILGDSPACYQKPASKGDSRTMRVALLYGGQSGEVSFYQGEDINESLKLAQLHDNRFSNFKDLSKDVPYLASICEETRLVVVAPKQLSTAKEPSLTLDRDGNMAVYVGRAACAGPGLDHTVYHPLTGKEVNVDVTRVTQLLEPILKEREQDGTNVFDLFSATFRRKDAMPTELVVLCVDCSRSMSGCSDFDTDEHDTQPNTIEFEDVVVDDVEDGAADTWDNAKIWLLKHESLSDMLHIVHKTTQVRRRQMAGEVVQLLKDLAMRELEEAIETLKSATRSYKRVQIQMDILHIRLVVARLSAHEAALCDLLVFKAEEPSIQFPTFSWSFGDPMPSSGSSTDTFAATDLGDDFCNIPDNYICPISHNVFEDPVNTSDGFTFDRKAIERWYRIRHSSPLTGLPLSDTSLRHNHNLGSQIRSWVQAKDVLEGLPSSPKRTRLNIRSTRAKVTFVTPSATFAREIPGGASLLDLYKVAFRGMRGMHSRFSLFFNGSELHCTEENIGRKGIVAEQCIVVTPHSAATSDTATTDSEMCLVKFYSSSDDSEPELCYWIPRHSDLTLGSVLFRVWNLRVTYGMSSYPPVNQMQIWSGLKYSGDGMKTGMTFGLSYTLSRLLLTLSPVEILREEPLCIKGSDVIMRTDVGQDRNGGDYPRARVLKLGVYRYESPQQQRRRRMKRQRQLTRMDVAKQVFSAFINRLIAYNFPTNVGLVVFGTKANIKQDLTDVVENFRQAVDKMEPHGDTALWDALALAGQHLTESEGNYPGIKKRIICLSDGRDTCSEKQVQDVCRTLLQNKIVVDSCSFGQEDNSELRTLSFLTGGYKFVPKSIDQAVAICELEPVLSQDERPDIVRPVIPALVNFRSARRYAVADKVTQDVFPQRKQHQNATDTFVEVTQFQGRTLTQSTAVSSTSNRNRRLLQEIRDVCVNPHPMYDVYVSESNMGFWKIVMQGPADSSYTTGTFVLYLDMDENYPRRPPKGRFITPVFHPNINRHGRICHSVFDRNWTVDTTNKMVLDTVFGLLLTPEFTDPINTTVTLNFYWDEVAFKDEVVKHIQKHASKPRASLKAEILGGGTVEDPIELDDADSVSAAYGDDDMDLHLLDSDDD